MKVYSKHLMKLRHIEETKGPEKNGSFVLKNRAYCSKVKKVGSKVLISAKKSDAIEKVTFGSKKLLLGKKSYLYQMFSI